MSSGRYDRAVGYVEKNLVEGEVVLFRPSYHWVRFVPGALGVVVAAVLLAGGAAAGETVVFAWLAAVTAVVSLAALLVRWVSDLFDEFAVTSMRVIRKAGLLTRDVRQVPLDKVQDLNIRANLWGRWLAYGDVEVQTAGQASTVVFPRIRHPEEFRNVLFAHRPGAGGAAPVPATAPSSAARPVEDRLKELERLRQQGLVTDDEYAKKREALLSEV